MNPKYFHAAIIVLSLLAVGTQPALGTKYIRDDATGGDATSIGDWDWPTKTCTLTTDVYETIQILADNLTLDGDGHTVTILGMGLGVSLNGRTGVTVKNINVQGSSRGIYLDGSSGNTLIGNTTSNSYYGITLRYYSDNNTLIGNTATDGYIGIRVYYSSGNTLIGNTLTGATLNGINLLYSTNNTLTGNTATNSPTGILLQGNNNGTVTGNFISDNSYGIMVFDTVNQILTGNTVENNSHNGIRLALCSYNTLTRNTVSSNGTHGVELYSCSNSQIYNNNFIANSTQAYVSGGSGNIFNLPAPTGGNYWSDWTGPDGNSDGFVDDPYVFTGGQDDLPWVLQDNWPNTSPPVADAGPDQPAIVVGESVQFDGSDSYDPDGTIASYVWDFGDTTQGSGEVVSHVYAAAGIHTVTLTVTDNDGATDSDTATVTVLTPAQAINGLLWIVEGMNLQQGIANSLDAKLEAVHEALIAANTGVREDAVNKLEAFVNAVEAQRGKVLTDDQADGLVIYAGWIIEALS